MVQVPNKTNHSSTKHQFIRYTSSYIPTKMVVQKKTNLSAMLVEHRPSVPNHISQILIMIYS